MIAIFEKHHDNLDHSSPIELGTVTNASPLQISLDISNGIVLDFTKGDFVLLRSEYLKINDRVAVCRLYSSHLFIVFGAVRGKLGQATVGDPALAVPLVKNGEISGPASAGTAHTHAAVGTAKIASE